MCLLWAAVVVMEARKRKLRNPKEDDDVVL